MQIDVVYAGFRPQLEWNKWCELFSRLISVNQVAQSVFSYSKANFTTCEHVTGGKVIGFPQGLK
jgi:hypothetical protein